MKSKLDYVYDGEYDVRDITIDESSKYGKSIDITDGIVFDLDKNGFPAALEIISASRILGIDKQNLRSSNIGLSIMIGDELICIELKFTYFVFKHEKDVCFKQNLANNYGIPAMETIFSTAWFFRLLHLDNINDIVCSFVSNFNDEHIYHRFFSYNIF